MSAADELTLLIDELRLDQYHHEQEAKFAPLVKDKLQNEAKAEILVKVIEKINSKIRSLRGFDG